MTSKRTSPEQKRIYDREYYQRAIKHWRFYTFRLSHEDYADLKIAAKQEGLKVPELIRMYIAWGLEEHDKVRHHCKAHKGTRANSTRLQR